MKKKSSLPSENDEDEKNTNDINQLDFIWVMPTANNYFSSFINIIIINLNGTDI